MCPRLPAPAPPTGSGDPGVAPAGGTGIGEDHGPEFGAQAVGLGRAELVGGDHALDHVGEHGDERTALDPHGHDGAVAVVADRAIDAHDARRAPEPRHDQAPAAGLAAEHTRRLGEIEGGGVGGGFGGGASGGHDPIVAGGCHGVARAGHRVAVMTELTPTQQKILALLRRGDEALVFDRTFVDDLTAEATTAVADLSARLGGTKLYVSKNMLTNVHGCEVRHLAPDDFEWNTSTASGFVAHKAIELMLNWRGTPTPAELVDDAIARLSDQFGGRGDFVARLDEADLAELRSKALDRTTKFMQDFPPLPAAAHPILESSIRWSPPGTIEMGGRADLVVGKPEGDESRLLIIDLKSGMRSPHHRDDLRFYALVETLRRGVPPRKLVTYYLDTCEPDAEDVTEGVLRSALTRALEGVARHVELVAEGRSATKRVGVACRWCPQRADCAEGQAYLDDREVDR